MKGLSNLGIAEALFIRPRTAATHVDRICSKLGVSSRAEATNHAARHDLWYNDSADAYVALRRVPVPLAVTSPREIRNSYGETGRGGAHDVTVAAGRGRRRDAERTTVATAHRASTKEVFIMVPNPFEVIRVANIYCQERRAAAEQPRHFAQDFAGQEPRGSVVVSVRRAVGVALIAAGRRLHGPALAETKSCAGVAGDAVGTAP
jgi:hypothetical protein